MPTAQQVVISLDILSNCRAYLQPRALQTGGGSVEVFGEGDFEFVSSDGQEGILREVRYVPSVPFNILSLDVMNNRGFSERTEGNKKYLINPGGEIALTARKYDEPFFFFDLSKKGALQLHAIGTLDDWHKRLAHYRIEKIKTMESKSMVNHLELGNPQTSVCSDCTVGNYDSLVCKNM